MASFALRPIAAFIAACISPCIALAQPLLTPLEQHRFLEITVAARSGKSEAVYVFSSEPEALEPFYARIDGQLLVDSASARGTGSHLSEIHPSAITVQQDGVAVAWAPGPLDEASSLYEARTEVRFALDRRVRFDVFGLTNDALGDDALVVVQLVDAADDVVWQVPVDRREVSYAGMGELAAGEYLFRVATIVRAEGRRGTGAWASAQVAAVLMVGETESCPCDWNMDAFLDTADLFQFLNDFFSNDADFDHSGSTDSADFFAFLGCILNGC